MLGTILKVLKKCSTVVSTQQDLQRAIFSLKKDNCLQKPIEWVNMLVFKYLQLLWFYYDFKPKLLWFFGKNYDKTMIFLDFRLASLFKSN